MSKTKGSRSRYHSSVQRLLFSVVLVIGCMPTGVAFAEGDKARPEAPISPVSRSVALTLASTSAFDFDIDWYLNDPDAETFYIDNASALYGLAALVNGTALDEDGTLIDAVDFEGRTIELDASVDLASSDGQAAEFVPIGAPGTPFNGTFDGHNLTISNLFISQTYTYAGLFGYAGETSTIKNLALKNGLVGGIKLSTDSEYIACIGPVVGKTDGVVSHCSSDVDVSIETHMASSEEHPFVLQYVGGLVGYARADITGCSYDGSLTAQIYASALNPDTSANSLRVADSFGGIVGRFGDPDHHGTLTDCSNVGDIIIQTYGSGGEDRFGTTTNAVPFFIGGIAGYSNGSVYRCYNGTYDRGTHIVTGCVLTGVYDDDGNLLNNRGGDQVGGIVGSLRGESDDPSKFNDGDPFDPMEVADCYNEAQITGLVAVGGIVGQTGVYCSITRCYNGSITDLSDWKINQNAGKVTSTRWNKPLSGGIVGQCRSGMISYCANYAEVRNIQTGYYMAGIAGCIFTSDDYPNVTGEIYACFNSGGIYTINEKENIEYREAGICGDNEGYIHDCIVMEGSVPYHRAVYPDDPNTKKDSPIGNMDWGVTSNLYCKSSAELQNPESAAILNAVATQNSDWSCYWFINREGYPVLNTWASLNADQQIELTADKIASVEQIEPAPYMGPGSASVPKLKVTLNDGTVLVQNTDFYVIPQAGAYEMSGQKIYQASIVGIGLYRGIAEGCANYSIGMTDLSQASIFISTEKYAFGKVVFPTVIEARISGSPLPADEYDYVIYGSQTDTSAVTGGGTAFAAFDSRGFVSYDAEGIVKVPVSEVGIDALNAEENAWWLWDRNGVLISDSTGKTYYSNGNTYAGTTNCVNLKAGTPAGYVVKISARDSSAVLSGSTIGYYVIEPVNLYQECTLEYATLGDETWYWDASKAKFYMFDETGNRIDSAVSTTFTGKMIAPVPTMSYGDYSLVDGKDIQTVLGNPNASEAAAIVDTTDSMRNRNVTGGDVRAAITVLPVNTQNLSNYVIAYFDIKPADFADCDIDLITPKIAYSGTEVEADVAVSLNGVKLIRDVDYTLEFTNNVEKGTAQFTVTPLANLQGGSLEPYVGAFEIADGVSLTDFTLEPIEDQQFNWGYDVHPKLHFVDASGNELALTEGVDYLLSFSGNKITKWPKDPSDKDPLKTPADKAPVKLTVTGKGLYTESLAAEFDIIPYDATANATNQLRAVMQNMSYGSWGKPSTKTATKSDGTKVPAGEVANVGANWPVLAAMAYPIVDWAAYDAGDYDSCYGDPVVQGVSNNNVNGGLLNRYPARFFDSLGTEVSHDGNVYTNASGAVIAEPKCAVPGPISVKLYFRTGTSGDGGGATGYLEESFVYTTPAELSSLVWSAGANSDRTYDGSECKPVTAKMSGTGSYAIEGQDYTIEYFDNVDAGMARFIATAVEGSNFTGTHTGQFSIMPLDLSKADAVTVEDIPDQELVDAEAGVEPVPAVRLDGVDLVPGVDFELRYQNNHTVGDNGVVSIMGKGNYTGTLTAVFSVVEPAPKILYGDVNRDGRVNAFDLLLMRRYIYRQVSFDEGQVAAAEVSGDGKVNALDVLLVKRSIYRQIDSFPVEQR